MIALVVVQVDAIGGMDVRAGGSTRFGRSAAQDEAERGQSPHHPNTDASLSAVYSRKSMIRMAIGDVNVSQDTTSL